MAKEFLFHPDWAADVRKALNELIGTYGINGPMHKGNEYAVFDFDNTTAIFDVEHQLCNYQLETMCFGMKPERIFDALTGGAGIKDGTIDRDLYEQAPKYGHHTYREWIDDIEKAYRYLYETYGPFEGKPLDQTERIVCQKDPIWLEFAAKMRCFYDLVCQVEEGDVCGWCPLFWFTDMTEQQVYDIAYESHVEGAKRPTRRVTWTSPDPAKVPSKIGQVSASFMDGVSTTENMRELWKALSENGIDVWVVSASGARQVQAAIDAWGLRPYCKGMMAMNIVTALADGADPADPGAAPVYQSRYDFAGHFYEAVHDHEMYHDHEAIHDLTGWIPDTNPKALPLDAVPHGPGKRVVIDEGLVRRYGCGPIAGFMDSSGDFCFCTEYRSLKLVVCFNRANRDVTDIGSLVAEAALYERDSLGYDLGKANAAGDTLYVLQGRDERGLRSFRSASDTIRFDQTVPNLLWNEQNEAVLRYIRTHSLTVKEAFDTFAVAKEEGDRANVLGFRFGYLKEYSGYHSR